MVISCVMGNCKHLDHAKHNEEVCNHLNGINGYYDWVITTAFYAATHYVRHKIIPYKTKDTSGKEIIYKDFETLFKAESRPRMGRHEYTHFFLSRHHPIVADEFKALKGMSVDARYINYQMGQNNSNNSRTLLRTIRDYCIK